MSNYNSVILMGRLTRDIELRFTPKGMAIGKLGLASNRTWKDEAGEQKEETCFVDVTAFGKQAETLSQYVKKGSPLFIAGRLKTESWEKDGQKRSKLVVVAETFRFIDGPPKDGAPTPKPAPPVAPQEAPPPAQDDVPF